MVEFLHGPPGAVHIAKGLMNQVEIEVIQPQLFQRDGNRLFRVLISLVLHPQLCRDKQLLAGNPAAADGPAHSRLVAIDSRCVDQTVASRQRVADAFLAHIALRHLEHAEAQQRHCDAIFQCCIFHKNSSFTFQKRS